MAKYVNSPESEIYHKSSELYGIYFAKQAIVRQNRCFLVEGYTDVISMHQSGIENVVASSGTSLTPGQIRLIHRFTENVTVIYDGDPAGIKASIRGIDLILEEGLNIKVLLLPDGDDPDSFARKHNASDFIEYVERNSSDFIRFKTNLLLADAGNDPVKRAGLVLDIVRSISIIPNSVIRSEYVKECSTLLNVDEAMLYHEINKLKNNEQEKTATRIQNDPQQNVEVQSTNTNSFNTVVSKFENEERTILQLLILYGQHIMYYTDDAKTIPVTAGDYIAKELEDDDLIFFNPLHQRMLEEYKTQSTDETFIPERYFLFHPDAQISHLAADLVTEKYVLSKVHSKVKKVEADSERLIELIPRVIFEFKNSLMLDHMRSMLLELKTAADNKNNLRVNEIMREIAELEKIKIQLSKTLGERIIIKI